MTEFGEAETLREDLRSHLTRVRAAAEHNEFVDAARAEQLHAELESALGRFDELDPGQRRVLKDAVAYLVRIDDEEDDLRSPVGFDDDAEVVEAAMARLR